MTRGQHPEAGAQGVGQEPGPVEADAVVVADGPAGGHGGPGHLVPGLPVVAAATQPPGRRSASGPSGGRPAKVK